MATRKKAAKKVDAPVTPPAQRTYEAGFAAGFMECAKRVKVVLDKVWFQKIRGIRPSGFMKILDAAAAGAPVLALDPVKAEPDPDANAKVEGEDVE